MNYTSNKISQKLAGLCRYLENDWGASEENLDEAISEAVLITLEYLFLDSLTEDPSSKQSTSEEDNISKLAFNICLPLLKQIYERSEDTSFEDNTRGGQDRRKQGQRVAHSTTKETTSQLAKIGYRILHKCIARSTNIAKTVYSLCVDSILVNIELSKEKHTPDTDLQRSNKHDWCFSNGKNTINKVLPKQLTFSLVILINHHDFQSTADFMGLKEDIEILSNNLFGGVLKCLEVMPEAATIFLSLLRTLCQCKHKDPCVSRLEALFRSIMSTYKQGNEVVSPILAVLSALHDLYLMDTVNVSFDVRKKREFWELLQDSLLYPDPLTKKRAIFLLKSAVNSIQSFAIKNGPFFVESQNGHIFWWDNTHAETLKYYWEMLFLIVETLDEKQPHIVLPVLSTFEELINSVVIKCPGYDCSFLGASWLTTVLKKGFQHDSKLIVRWAVKTSLNLDLRKTGLLEMHNQEFIFESLFSSLGHEFLYVRNNKLRKGEPPQILEDLQQFFQNCKGALTKEKQVQFFQKLMETFCQCDLNAIPFFYICKAIGGNLGIHFITQPILVVLRNTIACCISTFPVKIRRGICHCFTDILFSCMDCKDITPHEVVLFLCLLCKTEYMSYGDTIWESVIDGTVNCTDWFKHRQQFHLPQGISPITLFGDIFASIFGTNMDMFRDVIVKDNQEIVPLMFIWSLDTFAYVCSTKVDLALVEFQTAVQTILTTIWKGVEDFISKLNTNPYFPKQKIGTLLTFVLDILKHFLNKRNKTYKVGDCTKNTKTPWLFFSDVIWNFFLERIADSFYDLLAYIRTTITTMIGNGSGGQILAICLELQTVIFEICSSNNLRVRSLNEDHMDQILEVSSKYFSTVHVLRKDETLWCCMKCLVFVGGNIDKFCREDKCRQYFCRILEGIKRINLMHYECKTQKPDKCLGIGEDSNTLTVYISDIISSLWEIIFLLLDQDILPLMSQSKAVNSREEVENVCIFSCNELSLVSAVIEGFSYVTSKDLMALLRSLQAMLPRICDIDKDFTLWALSETWRLFMEQNRRDAGYWELLPHFSAVLFNTCLLPSLAERTKFYWQEMFAIGDEKGGVFNSVTDYISTHWLGTDFDKKDEIFFGFLDLFVDAFMFGQIYRKSLVILRDTKEYITAHISDVQDDEDERHDFLVRAKLLGFCFSLHKELKGGDFVYCLVKKLIEKDNNLSVKHKRYFGDSLVHRQKLRIWQTVLVLIDILDLNTVQDEYALITSLFESLYFDNQPSVRRFIEWITVLVFARYPMHLDKLWQKIEKGGESRIGILMSLISIVYHLGSLLEGPRLLEFASTACSRLLRWTQIHHMQVKLHAQVVLYHFWKLSEQNNWSEVLLKYKAVSDCFMLTDTNSSVVKHRFQLAKSFFFSTFHPSEHYSLDTIFRKFLYLSDVADDEWLDCRVFSLSGTRKLMVTDTLSLTVEPLNEDLKSAEEDTNAGTSRDVQKKISPIKILPPLEDPVFQDAYYKIKERGQSKLILCASLVDRTPNLGGLCRTCEIFGVSTLVLGSLKYLQDATFKSLSVSSERWVKIEQVIPRRIKAYLEEQKSEGYRIVGVEQTAESCSLEKYIFHEKTVLLLGNEKEGIPANIIQLVDDCVEIPQEGIIRSLNVHVSGAIMIWEYNKQKLLKKE